MVLYCDRRTGGAEWSYGRLPNDWNMRVPDSVLDSVCFLCVKERKGSVERFRYSGTAFFLGQSIEGYPGVAVTYLITAKHNIEKAKIESADLYARVNHSAGSAHQIKLPDDWYFPESGAADVAVLSFFLNEEWDNKLVPREMGITDEVIKKYGVGVGDEIIIVGLFTERTGTHRNLPIVRSGVVASMADEPLVDKNSGEEYLAYLAEVRSIRGLSGSPVFVHLPGVRGRGAARGLGRDTFLLGVIRGHWEYEGVGLDFAFDEDEKINTGIAIVSRMQDVAKILDCEELVKQRKKAARDQMNPPVEDSAFEPKLTKSGFDQSLKKVSRRTKPSPPEQASSET